MFIEKKFRENLIKIIKSMYPDLVAVNRFQNVTQPVDISSGDKMIDILVERVRKLGSDWVDRIDTNGNTVMHGERLVQVTMELFAEDALDMMNAFVAMLETDSYIDFMVNLKIMHQRSGDPRSGTRLHGGIKYIPSAIYTTRFHIGIEYIDGIGDPFSATADEQPNLDEFVPAGAIDNGEIVGNIDDKEPIKTTF